MARLGKTTSVIKAEGKSHRTKAELASREKTEEAMLTGMTIEETEEIKHNPVAHAEFQRLMSIMTQIGKNDELFGAPCRRYCLVTAELKRLTEAMDKIEESKTGKETAMELAKIEEAVLRIEKVATSLRKQLAEFEHSNGMNVASSLRLIPQMAEDKAKEQNPFLALMNE